MMLFENLLVQHPWSLTAGRFWNARQFEGDIDKYFNDDDDDAVDDGLRSHMCEPKIS